MKKIICLSVLFLFLVSCSSEQEDEVLVQQTVENVYKSFNKRDFKNLESLSSDNMRLLIRKLKEDNVNFAEFKKFSLQDVEITGQNAVATVESTDVFGNTVTNTWDLIKENGQWKLNSFNSSRALPIENEMKNDSKKDTLYN